MPTSRIVLYGACIWGHIHGLIHPVWYHPYVTHLSPVQSILYNIGEIPFNIICSIFTRITTHTHTHTHTHIHTHTHTYTRALYLI